MLSRHCLLMSRMICALPKKRFLAQCSAAWSGRPLMRWGLLAFRFYISDYWQTLTAQVWAQSMMFNHVSTDFADWCAKIWEEQCDLEFAWAMQKQHQSINLHVTCANQLLETLPENGMIQRKTACFICNCSCWLLIVCHGHFCHDHAFDLGDPQQAKL